MSIKIGIVVIGRNEGERLKHCLSTLLLQIKRIIYVDSGSTDDSVRFAQSVGVVVVNLDMSIPFNAGRARNEGFDKIIQLWSDTDLVQFVDGDCELEKGWLAHAESNIRKNNSWAIVAGRVKERYPEKSIYNLLCDMEWDTPIEEIDSCGGIFLIRAKAFQEMHGFNTKVIAGEEPELCYRLRRKKWSIHRLDFPMALHDADMTNFLQWWKRCIRSGHAFAQGYALHGTDGQHYCFRDSLRIWTWTLLIPGLILLLTFVMNPLSLLLFVLYPLQFIKIAITANKRIKNWQHSFAYAVFNMLGKWPELVGQVLFIKRKLAGKKFSIIEYN